jgi:hypothetical protein
MSTLTVFFNQYPPTASPPVTLRTPERLLQWLRQPSGWRGISADRLLKITKKRLS